MLVRCGTSACNDIIHPWLLSSTPSSLSKAKVSTEDLNQNSFFFLIPILSFRSTTCRKFLVLSLLSIIWLGESLINAIGSIQSKASEEDRNPNSLLSRHLLWYHVCLLDEVPLPYVFFLSPALCESRDEILFKGVVLSHSKIFNFGLWVSFRMCSAIFRVFREFSRFFLKLFSFSCELISFIWMALKYFSRVSNILFGLLYPVLSSAIVGKFSDLRIIFFEV